jgi:beta-1,4-mannosyltransferase
MERSRGAGTSQGAFTTEATAAFRVVSAHPQPYLLAAFPSYLGNPYQALLYGSVWDEGFAPVRMPRWNQLPELHALQDAGLPTVLHLHWLQPVLRDADSNADARRRGAKFIEELDAYRDRGGKLVWTIHNVLPHETRHEAEEVALCAALAERADIVHVLTKRTPELVAPHYDLPRKRVLHVPHPSYAGAYPDHVSRHDARHALGLLPDELVVAAVGDIRAYKGLDDLLDAWQDVPTDRPRRLLIAGAPLRDQGGAEAIIERAAIDPRVLIDARRIPPDELQVILRATDVMILPYRQALNSGALLLALTFGVPVIVPDGAGFGEILDPSFARTFQAGDRASLADALTRAQELATLDASRAALGAAARYEPRALSARFARELRARLER